MRCLDLWATSITSFPIHGNAAYSSAAASAAVSVRHSFHRRLTSSCEGINERRRETKSPDIEILGLSSAGSKKQA
jgi:hypothetical protein